MWRYISETILQVCKAKTALASQHAGNSNNLTTQLYTNPEQKIAEQIWYIYDQEFPVLEAVSKNFVTELDGIDIPMGCMLTGRFTLGQQEEVPPPDIKICTWSDASMYRFELTIANLMSRFYWPAEHPLNLRNQTEPLR